MTNPRSMNDGTTAVTQADWRDRRKFLSVIGFVTNVLAKRLVPFSSLGNIIRIL